MNLAPGKYVALDSLLSSWLLCNDIPRKGILPSANIPSPGGGGGSLAVALKTGSRLRT